MPARLPIVLVLSLAFVASHALVTPGVRITENGLRLPIRGQAAASGAGALYLPIANPYSRGLGSPAPVGRHEGDGWPVILGGPWERLVDERASGGAYLASRSEGASAEIVFDGDSIALLRTVDAAGGEAEVLVDGVPIGTLGFGFGERRWQVPAVFDRLGEGAHRLVLRARSDRPVFLDAFVVPSPFDPSPDQAAAIARLNAYRATVGLPLARWAGAAGLGGQAHADYEALHHEGHGETPGRPGFTGTTPSARVSLFGVSRRCGEVMAGVDGPAAAVDFGPERVVDFWMQSVFHRLPLLGYGSPEVGYGHTRRGGERVVEVGVLDWCDPEEPALAERLIYTYPADGQAEVPLDFSSDTETPDPLPEHSGATGYPISLHIAQPPAAGGASTTPLTVSAAELQDADGRRLPAFMLGAADWSGLIAPDELFLIPHSPLRMSQRYSVHVAGRDSRGLGFDHSWSFTTQIATRFESIDAIPGPCEADIRWQTAGATRSWLEYGPTPAYGARVDDPQPEPARQHRVQLNGLRLGMPYHYRVWVEDLYGNRADSGDATFTAGTGPMIQPGPVEPGACRARLRWATACGARSWIDFGPTPAYGRRIDAPAPAKAHSVLLDGLDSETTYHYRISAADASGELSSGPDETFTTAAPRTLRVPEERATIGEALAEAGPCDTVRVAPGSYAVRLSIPPRVHLIGAGAERTLLRGLGSDTVVRLADGAELRGFTITGGSWSATGISIGAGASPTLRNNRVQGNSYGIAIDCAGPSCAELAPLIANNVIVGNSRCGLCWNRGAPLIVNNTIAANGTGISGQGPAIVVNNIVSGNLGFGIVGTVRPETVHHNNVWGNATDYDDIRAEPGPGSLATDPRFVAAAQGDYRLQADSPCRGAGDPDPARNNPDGSRGDMGAYGGPWAEE